MKKIRKAVMALVAAAPLVVIAAPAAQAGTVGKLCKTQGIKMCIWVTTLTDGRYQAKASIGDVDGGLDYSVNVLSVRGVADPDGPFNYSDSGFARVETCRGRIILSFGATFGYQRAGVPYRTETLDNFVWIC
ncbi:hypothetical protein ACIBF1_30080 [Spirillospora sp. NPDC050679]